MSEERKLILEMLKEGKITNDEALKLLDAVKESNPSEKINEKEKTIETKVNSFASKILSSVESALSKAGEAIENIDFNFSTSNFTYGKNTKTVSDIMRIDTVNHGDNIFINSKNGKIEVQGWDEMYINCKYEVSYDQREFDGTEEFVVHKFENNNHYIGINDSLNHNCFSVKMTISIPKDMASKIFAQSTNAKILFSELTANDIEVNTTNAKIEFESIESEKIVINTTNGKIELSDIVSDIIESNTTNGKHEYSEIDAREITAYNTNGSIYLSGISDRAELIHLQSTNGGLYIEDIKINKPAKAVIKGRFADEFNPIFSSITKSEGSTIAKTPDYSEKADSLLITLQTTNGKVSII